MAKSVEDRDRGARRARRDEGAYCLYVTEEQRSPPGCIGREIDRLSHSRALRSADAVVSKNALDLRLSVEEQSLCHEPSPCPVEEQRDARVT